MPSDQTLDKLNDALRKHLTPKPLIIPSRHKFLNRKQNERGSNFALKGRVENEIVEREGIVEQVESSEWATPVVPVVKTDGSIKTMCRLFSNPESKFNCPSSSFTKIGRNIW
ncbi:hypothetical protein TNCT_96211 [Trichonephila clavata]|uniref:Reverse transcriptase n=1 Tax=Trichonephila clavata TaxID=2740835 RepID=A0A8X6KTU8_TRICU|nr:hypothetical protein TNCT_96211 [Trichonephila clavata]